MNLQSPIFDSIRIPSRQGMYGLAEPILKAHGVDPDKFRKRRGRNAYTPQSITIRREILEAARAAKIYPSYVAIWFGHPDSTIVRRWYDEMDGVNV